METLDTREVLIRLLVALACAAPIGWERGRKHHPAGLRTHILVCLGATSFVLVALSWVMQHANGGADPLRVLQGITNGIGLLAGGALIQARGSVHGFTTAATIWVIAAVGVACGYGEFTVAIALAALTLLVNTVIVFIDPKELAEKKKAAASRSSAEG